jgi:hypothetical protein
MLKNWKSWIVFVMYIAALAIGTGYTFWLANWPFWWCIILVGIFFYYFMKGGAGILNDLLYEADKGPFQELSFIEVHLRVIAVFLVSIACAWIAFGVAGFFFRYNGAVTQWLLTIPIINELLGLPVQLPHEQVPPRIVMIFQWMPPGRPGLLGFVSYLILLVAGLGSFDIAVYNLVNDAGRFRRGSKLTKFTKAKRTAKKQIVKNEPGIPWGGVTLPMSAGPKHWMVTGTIGSGKTITIRMLMQSVLSDIGSKDTNRCAVIIDPKQEYLPYLDGMKLKCPITIVNPFDSRCAAWDIAFDCSNPAAAREIASILVPPDNGHNHFFYDSTRHIVTGVITSLVKQYGRNWTFRDLLLILFDKTSTRKMLERTPQTTAILNYADHENVFNDIHSTIMTQIAPFETIAAAWSHATKKFSLREFLYSDSILLLTFVEEIREPMLAIYRVLFKRLSEFILSQPETDSRQTWVFIDEAKEAGALDGIGRLMTEGRSKGACVVLGFQDVEGMQEVYKDKIANELMGQCSHKAILRTHNAAAAEWCSQVIGEYEAWEQTFGFPVDGSINRNSPMRPTNGSKRTVNESITKKRLILPSEIMNLPPVDKKNGIAGYYLTPSTGCFPAKLPWKWIRKHIQSPGRAPSFSPRPDEEQYIPPFSSEDCKRFGFDFIPTSPTPPEKNDPSSALRKLGRKFFKS